MVTLVYPADVESALSETETETLADLARDKTVLELGAWLGRSTIAIAQTAARLYSVDWHHGDPHAGDIPTLGGYFSNLHRYGLAKQVITIVGRFEHVYPILRPGAFDLIFLDGFHSYEAVKADAEAIKALHAGTVVFHDYGIHASSKGGGAFGVTQAVQETFGTPRQVIDTLAIFRGA